MTVLKGLNGRVTWVSVITWSVCTLLLTHFSRKVTIEYMEENLVTVVSQTPPPSKPETVRVRVCNEVYLDSEKIKNFSKTASNNDSFSILHEIIIQKSDYSNTSRIYRHPFRNYFKISSEMYEHFSLEAEQFILACDVSNSNQSCIPGFKFYLDQEVSCYETQVDIQGYGIYQYLRLVFFFDPKKTLGSFTRKLGAYVMFSHTTDHVNPGRGIFVAPKDAVVVSATGVHKNQGQSFGKSRCTQRNGLETYNFTGMVDQNMFLSLQTFFS